MSSENKSSLSPDKVFYAQLFITILGLGITGVMMVTDRENSSVYIPIMTSLLFSWSPSPSSSVPDTTHSQKLDSLFTELQTLKTHVKESIKHSNVTDIVSPIIEPSIPDRSQSIV